MRRIVFAVFVSLVTSAALGNAQLAPIRISYATTSGIRSPLWIAEDARLFEKYGLDAKLINIPSGNTAISALVSGEVDVVSGSGSASIVAAGRGLPVVIVGSFGSTTYKLVANPGITDLRGKIVGTSRIGSTTDFALRRTLSMLGLTPDKDVKILATGIGEADKRIMLMLQGRMDGTIGSPESIFAAETQAKVKIEILADLEEMKIYNTVGDISTRTDVLKNRRDLLRSFFMACSEAIALGKKNKATAQRVLAKHMKITDRKRLDIVYEASLGRMPSKPYPREEAVQLELESVAFTDPLFKTKRVSEFMDSSIIAELERQGFFIQLK
ncbi:MAG: ABC transporter substrate-binding protein [Candidatus Binatia bacterium]|jgi:NitT/TauT family transport system substrate-binding protein|nr:ABC transporter substrate-binding protein [Candidatus Binatia bacterium]